MSVSFSKATTQTSRFEHSIGFSVGITTSASFNAPFVGEVGVEVSASVDNTWTYGQEHSESKTWTATFPVNVPAGKVFSAIASVKRAELVVPYVGTVYFEGTTITKKVYGTYKGVDVFNMHYTVKDITPL